MADWKKLVVSGSNISQLNNDSQYLTAASAAKAFATASHNGVALLANSSAGTLSFVSGSGQGLVIEAQPATGDLYFGLSAIPNASLLYSGSVLGNTPVDLGDTVTTLDGLTLTGVQASGSFSGSFQGTANLPDLTSGIGIDTFTYDGSDTATVALANGGNLQNDTIQKWDGGSGFFVNSGMVEADSILSSANSIQFTGTNSSLTGSFTGSFVGDGSGLTGLVSTLNISGSTGDGSVDLLSQALSIVGTSLEVETSVSGQTVTIGLPDDVTIGNNLTVTGDLFVNGSTTQINTTELLVEDKFILLASGSATAGDAGIIIDRGSDAGGNVAYGFDSATGRWGFQNGLTDTTNAIAIGTDGNSAFAGYVFTEAAHSSAPTTGEFVAAGAIYTATSGDIFIYS
jgi:hypothetical protein